MSELKLKPCPFCGGKAKITQVNEPRYKEIWYLSCTNKDCLFSPQFVFRGSKEELIEAWNRRGSDKNA